MYHTNPSAAKRSKVFTRYQKNPIKIKCGNSNVNLGQSPFAENINITLKQLTNPLPKLDPIELLRFDTAINNSQINNDIKNITKSLFNLDRDANLKIGSVTIVNLENLKHIIIGLVLVVGGGLLALIGIKLKKIITLFWRRRYNSRPERFNLTRLSTRNVNRTQTDNNSTN